MISSLLSSSVVQQECFCTEPIIQSDINAFLLNCGCLVHVRPCFSLYIRSKLSDRFSFSEGGIRCPYGTLCREVGEVTHVISPDQVENLNIFSLEEVLKYRRFAATDTEGTLFKRDCSGLEMHSIELISATTKQCPKKGCEFRLSHYHGHACEKNNV